MSVEKTAKFIEKAQEIHGDLYDYSKTVYGKNNKEKVIIIDPLFGEFLQSPDKHLEGKGNYKRGRMMAALKLKMTFEKFVEKSREIHKFISYDYSKVVYVNNNTPVIIIDPLFGEFEQRPADHLMGKLGGKRAGNSRLTRMEFIERSITIHGDLYDYSKVVYINNSTPVIIIDLIYGEFEQRPACHLSGKGNPKRSKERVANMLRFTKEQFIENAVGVHGVYFDYSKVKYNGSDIPVIIIDPEHGEFEKTPYEHIHNKSGHPKNTLYGYNKHIHGHFYIHNDARNNSKAGITNREVAVRLKETNKSFYTLTNEEVTWFTVLDLYFIGEDGGFLAWELENKIQEVTQTGRYSNGINPYMNVIGYKETYIRNDDVVNKIIIEFYTLHKNEVIVLCDTHEILGETIEQESKRW